MIVSAIKFDLDEMYIIVFDITKELESEVHGFPVTGPRSAVGNVSGYRCVSGCRIRGREFDPGPVPYFRGD